MVNWMHISRLSPLQNSHPWSKMQLIHSSTWRAKLAWQVLKEAYIVPYLNVGHIQRCIVGRRWGTSSWYRYLTTLVLPHSSAYPDAFNEPFKGKRATWQALCAQQIMASFRISVHTQIHEKPKTPGKQQWRASVDIPHEFVSEAVDMV